MTPICYDYGPHEIGTRHGRIWFTAWVPTPEGSMYIGGAIGRRWANQADNDTISWPWLRVRRTFRKKKASLHIQRWCGHIDVRYED